VPAAPLPLAGIPPTPALPEVPATTGAGPPELPAALAPDPLEASSPQAVKLTSNKTLRDIADAIDSFSQPSQQVLTVRIAQLRGSIERSVSSPIVIEHSKRQCRWMIDASDLGTAKREQHGYRRPATVRVSLISNHSDRGRPSRAAEVTRLFRS
jgi:hypothetical protein